MRQLNKRQQRILNTFIISAEYQPRLGFNIDDFPALYEALETVNAYETLWSDVNRYVRDQGAQLLYGGRQ